MRPHLRSLVPSAPPGIHWYGKAESRAGRKMAHLTVTADSLADLAARVAPLGVATAGLGLGAAGPRVGIIMGSDRYHTPVRPLSGPLSRPLSGPLSRPLSRPLSN